MSKQQEKTVENIDIMKKAYEYLCFPLKNFQLNKIHGHSGCLGNELVDALCTKNISKFNKLVIEKEEKEKN